MGAELRDEILKLQREQAQLRDSLQGIEALLTTLALREQEREDLKVERRE